MKTIKSKLLAAAGLAALLSGTAFAQEVKPCAPAQTVVAETIKPCAPAEAVVAETVEPRAPAQTVVEEKREVPVYEPSPCAPAEIVVAETIEPCAPAQTVSCDREPVLVGARFEWVVAPPERATVVKRRVVKKTEVERFGPRKGERCEASFRGGLCDVMSDWRDDVVLDRFFKREFGRAVDVRVERTVSIGYEKR